MKRRAVSIAAGTAAAAALTVGSMFNTADELLGGTGDETAADAQAAIVEMRAEAVRPQTPPEHLRAFFLRQNAFVRSLLLLPLWAIGKAGITALSLLWTALSPYWSVILGVLFNALLLVALFLFVYKALFPNRSVGKLFKKGRWAWFLGGALLLAAADAILKIYWADYQAVSIFIKLFCGFWVLVTLCFRIYGRKSAQA